MATLCEAFKRSGANITQQPTNYSWAYQMEIEDLDGNVLSFGSEPEDDEPFND